MVPTITSRYQTIRPPLTYKSGRPSARCWYWAQSTYICRVQSCVWRLPKYWPPTPLPPSECTYVSSPPQERRGVHNRRAVRGWGVNILEDARHWIGLLKYNLSTVLGEYFGYLYLFPPQKSLRFSVIKNLRDSNWLSLYFLMNTVLAF